jgi:hypothetical protein
VVRAGQSGYILGVADSDDRRTRRGWNAVKPDEPAPEVGIADPAVGTPAPIAAAAAPAPIAAAGTPAPIAAAPAPIAPIAAAAPAPITTPGGWPGAAPLSDARGAEVPVAVALPPRAATEIETFSGTFLAVSLRRAFRLQIRTEEVLPSERAALAAEAKHIIDPEHQAFLAWRRSVLLLVATIFIPLTAFRFWEAFEGPNLPPMARMFVLLPAVAEAAFCLLAFDQLKNWTRWQKQRRILFLAWGLYFFAPFLVYLYPFRSAFDDSYQALREAATALSGLNVNTVKKQQHMLVGMLFGVQALLALGPKVISLMPGVIRASIVTKLLFPGTTAPGWLMMLAAPFYALFAYIIVLMPYQITGSWEFLVGNSGIMFAQVFIGVSGRRLTKPLSAAESHHRIHRNWLYYIGMLIISAGFMVYGLSDFIRELHIGPVRIVTGILSFLGNVLVLTLIGTDAIVASMARFRRTAQPDAAAEVLQADAERKLAEFCR